MKKIALLFTCILLASCLNDDNDIIPIINTIDYDAVNETDIITYLSDNNLTAEKTASGLYYIITSEGDGDSPIASSNVTLGYKGYFLNGNVFDESTNATFNLAGLITGFSEATQLLKEGGSGTFILPSRLAYGTQGSGSISPGDVIIFDINLITVN